MAIEKEEDVAKLLGMKDAEFRMNMINNVLYLQTKTQLLESILYYVIPKISMSKEEFDNIKEIYDALKDLETVDSTTEIDIRNDKTR